MSNIFLNNLNVNCPDLSKQNIDNLKMSSLNQGHNNVQLNETFKIVNPDSQSSSNNNDSKFCISGSDFQALTTYFGQPAVSLSNHLIMIKVI